MNRTTLHVDGLPGRHGPDVESDGAGGGRRRATVPRPCLAAPHALTVWSRDLVLFTDGPSGLTANGLDRLARNDVMVDERRIEGLRGRDGQLEAVRLVGGEEVSRQAMFFITGQQERSGLAADLGCRFNSQGTVETGNNESTEVPGLSSPGTRRAGRSSRSSPPPRARRPPPRSTRCCCARTSDEIRRVSHG